MKKSKPVRSRTIEDFMAALEFEKIIALHDKEGSNAKDILARLQVALQAILDGVDAQTALGIESSGTGPAPDAATTNLALMMEIAKTRGDDWDTVKALSDDFLRRSGRTELSLSRLKAIRKDQGDNARRLLRWAQAINDGASKGSFEKISAEAANLLSVVMNLERFVRDPRSVEIALDAVPES